MAARSSGESLQSLITDHDPPHFTTDLHHCHSSIDFSGRDLTANCAYLNILLCTILPLPEEEGENYLP